MKKSTKNMIHATDTTVMLAMVPFPPGVAKKARSIPRPVPLSPPVVGSAAFGPSGGSVISSKFKPLLGERFEADLEGVDVGRVSKGRVSWQL